MVKLVKHNHIGARVIPAPNWSYGNQAGEAEYGIIIDDGYVDEDGWATVEWYSKDGRKLGTNVYEVGDNDTYELAYHPKHSIEVDYKKFYEEHYEE